MAFDSSGPRCTHKLQDYFSRYTCSSSIVDSSCNVSSSSRTLSDMPESILMFVHCYNRYRRFLVVRSIGTWFAHRFYDRMVSDLLLMRMSRRSFDILGLMRESNSVFPTIVNRALWLKGNVIISIFL